MGKWLSKFDSRTASAINRLPKSYLSCMSIASFIGEPYTVITIGLLGYLVAYQRQSENLQKAFLYAFVAYGLNIFSKLLLRRRRPHGSVVRTFGIKSYSFPSGHAFGSVIFYGLFAYLDLKYVTSPYNVIMTVLIGILIISIGISRVHLGKHYPSDVFAGWVGGGLSLILIGWLAF